MILSKARIEEIQQDINNCKYKNEKDYMILDLCDTLLSQMPCESKEIEMNCYLYDNPLNQTEDTWLEIENENKQENKVMCEGDGSHNKEGPKDTSGKTDWSVIPWDVMEEICKIFEYGKEKYGAPFTYRKGIKFSKLYSAIMRHLFSWWKGKDCDKESGYKHLAHICANAMMLMSMENKIEFDDRDKK